MCMNHSILHYHSVKQDRGIWYLQLCKIKIARGIYYYYDITEGIICNKGAHSLRKASTDWQ